jgi:hypothetical protein
MLQPRGNHWVPVVKEIYADEENFFVPGGNRRGRSVLHLMAFSNAEIIKG